MAPQSGDAGSLSRSRTRGLPWPRVMRRARCQRQTNSVVTPMSDEMFYRYQQSLIDEAATTLAALLQRVRHPHA